MHSRWIAPTQAALLLFTLSAWAASPPKTVAPADDISAPAKSSNAPSSVVKKMTPAGTKDKVLWDYWYTVTVNKSVHAEYYNDRAELKQGRIVFQNHAWKREEDFINEEQLGVFAEDNPELTPLFFNFHSTYRSLETTIDGNVNANHQNKELVVRVRKGTTEQPLIKKMIPSKTFFSELFPIWLGNRLPTFKIDQLYSFQTVLEDNLEAEFMTINGQVRALAPDDYARETHTAKLAVNYRELDSLWWVDSAGAPVRIEMPAMQKTVVQRVAKEIAQKFLSGGG